MGERQLDLFAATGSLAPSSPAPGPQDLDPAKLDDDALIAAIPEAGLADAPALAAEAAERGLAAAVPALERLALRFAGFGLERAVPEQVAALRALAQIGGRPAAQAVARLITREIVQGPTRKLAVEVAARLAAVLPVETLAALLVHPDPQLRANACRCAHASPTLVPLLLDLTTDPDREVAVAAWCALGRMGRAEARAALSQRLRDAPSTEVIDAIAAIADEEALVLLGRIARTRPSLADAAIEALEASDHARARQILATVTATRGGGFPP
jgi:hypothetical protein